MRCHTAWVERKPGRHVTVERVRNDLMVGVEREGERAYARADMREITRATPGLAFIIRNLVAATEAAITRAEARYPILGIEAMARVARGLAPLDRFGQVPVDWRAVAPNEGVKP